MKKKHLQNGITNTGEIMKLAKTLLPMICLAFAGCKSTEMTLKDYNRSIPPALVKEYNESGKAYVDEGEYLNLPLLMKEDEYIVKEKDGFRLYSNSNWAGLLADKTVHSDFDSQGKLLDYESYKHFLTPLFFRKKYSFSYRSGRKQSSKSVRFLFGAFGLERKAHQETELIFLWL